MEAVAAEMILFVILLRDRVAIGLRGHRHMEGSVEHGNLGLVRHDLLAGLNAHQVSGIVQRAERDAVADCLLAGLVDQAGGSKLHTAVHHAMTDGVDLVHGTNHADFRILKNLQNGGNRLGMGGHRDLTLDLQVALRNLVRQTAVDADSLAKTLGKNEAGFGVHELILEGGAASVNNQNFHVQIS